MSNYFSLKKDTDNFSKAGFLGKLGNGSLIATKIVANVGIFAGKLMAESILDNKNATTEQKNKAR